MGKCICIETHTNEQTLPWVIGNVMEGAHAAAAVSPPLNGGVRLDSFKQGDLIVDVHLHEALEPGSAQYTPTSVWLCLPAAFELEPVRSSRRSLAIRAEVPSMDDEWEVEEVRQYRTYYCRKQWLVKWKNYRGEDRNTWEFKENLLGEKVQQQAQRGEEAHLAAKEPREKERAGGRGPRAPTRNEQCLLAREARGRSLVTQVRQLQLTGVAVLPVPRCHCALAGEGGQAGPPTRDTVRGGNA